MRKEYSIWDEMRKMQEQMDSLFGNFFNSEPFGSHFLLDDVSGSKDLVSSNFKAPASDFYETENEVVAEIDMPGVDKGDIKINVTKDSIEVKAEKKHESKVEDKKKGLFRLERSYGGFYRKFGLPSNVDSNNAEAEFKNGVLNIKVPKLKIEQKKKKLLEIK